MTGEQQRIPVVPTSALPAGAGTVALVTGGARGLGRAVAGQLAARGVEVLVGSRRPDEAVAATRGLPGVSVLPAPLDLTDQRSVDAALRVVEETRGRLDVLVNNAAAPPDWDNDVVEADLAAAARVLEVDLFGTWRMTISALPLLRRSPGPRVVNVSSGAGSHADGRYGLAVSGGAFPGHAIGKAAVNALTSALAAALADTPVLVNAVCPDVTATVPGAAARGARPAAASAPGVVWAATLPPDGPRGGFHRDGAALGW
ncbi:SDR family NAD(P)-dependent oxidoreductase [Streptomyces sp. DSM 44915]|uniref:SDR family NAD(P)-dependent oxidoreductase n=1 Tax=Streptomyces chisholmiae TaxID=3075540 RepID=A0ABU2JXA1_9ACTN|nr:SDR family NAD(P)-dependent oxidoreductase [Streptomyces sp. DSM 44915]MDT0269622.1 SDR family NAD(P)-dependent oxidoreductase [Streptomyces sp. DSM 44915]